MLMWKVVGFIVASGEWPSLVCFHIHYLCHSLCPHVALSPRCVFWPLPPNISDYGIYVCPIHSLFFFFLWWSTLVSIYTSLGTSVSSPEAWPKSASLNRWQYRKDTLKTFHLRHSGWEPLNTLFCFRKFFQLNLTDLFTSLWGEGLVWISHPEEAYFLWYQAFSTVLSLVQGILFTNIHSKKINLKTKYFTTLNHLISPKFTVFHDQF